MGTRFHPLCSACLRLLCPGGGAQRQMGSVKGGSEPPRRLCIIKTKSVQILLSLGRGRHLQTPTPGGQASISSSGKWGQNNPLCRAAVRIKQALLRERDLQSVNAPERYLRCKPAPWNFPGSSGRGSGTPVVSSVAACLVLFPGRGALQPRGCADPFPKIE